MTKSRYVDTAAIVQVLGNVYNNVSLLDNENYKFYEEDFPEDLHRILFGTIYNLHDLGAKEITLNAIEDYLTQRPSSYGIYKTNKGAEYLTALKNSVQPVTFDYYYQRMKKFTLLRMYNEKCGMDLSNFYDVDNITNVKKKQVQEDWLDNSSLEEIADAILTNNHIPHISIFITAPEKRRVQRFLEINKNVTPNQAKKWIESEDIRHLKTYKFYTGRKWSKASNYDICINSASYGIKGSIELIIRMLQLDDRVNQLME